MAPPSGPKYLPKTPILSHWKVGLQYVNLGEHKHWVHGKTQENIQTEAWKEKKRIKIYWTELQLLPCM